MTLTNPKPLGWAFGEILTSAQMNSIGTQLTRALDGTGGGTYTLANPLVVEGNVVGFDDVIINDDLTVNDDVLVSGDLTVGGNTTVGSAAVDTNTVNATSTFNAPVTFVDSALFGEVSINGAATIGNSGTDAATLNAVMTPAGTGRVRDSGAVLPNADTSVDVATARYLYAVPATTAKTYTLSCTNAADGDWFRFVNGGGVSATLAGLVSLVLGPGIGRMYMRISGTWTLVDIWSA